MPNASAAKRKTTKRDAGPSAKQLKWMAQQLRLAPAALSDKLVERIETSFRDKPDGLNRRMALIAMVKSGNELLDLANSDREGAVVVASLAEAAKLCHKNLLQLADIIKAAELRALTALSERKDRDAVIAEAQAGFEYSEPVEAGHA
jgi:hypothetical protein